MLFTIESHADFHRFRFFDSGGYFELQIHPLKALMLKKPLPFASALP